ncbi:MAG TPA: hypothetical protein IAA58_10050 [Candidatus Gallacutalibacter stercoravium]|nr:hypothetical protein [Candidatus Gallacutalibacter stercoravium]
MNQDGKVGLALVFIGIVGIFIAIAFCAVELVSTSVMVAMIVCALCIPGFYFAFCSWQDPPESKEEEESSKEEKL